MKEAHVYPRPLADDPTEATPQSKELTDKIHRLVRRFSKELVQLVSLEIGARAVKVRGKPGPKVGFKPAKKPCPLCRKNPNVRRRYGYICKECNPNPKVPNKKLTHGKYTGGYKVEVELPKHLPVAPQAVEVEDTEPDFLDTITKVVEAQKPKEPPAAPKPVKTSDEGFW